MPNTYRFPIDTKTTREIPGLGTVETYKRNGRYTRLEFLDFADEEETPPHGCSFPIIPAIITTSEPIRMELAPALHVEAVLNRNEIKLTVY